MYCGIFYFISLKRKKVTELLNTNIKTVGANNMFTVHRQ